MLIMSCSKRALLLLEEKEESVGATGNGGRDFAVADSRTDIQTFGVTMLHKILVHFTLGYHYFWERGPCILASIWLKVFLKFLKATSTDLDRKLPLSA